PPDVRAPLNPGADKPADSVCDDHHTRPAIAAPRTVRHLSAVTEHADSSAPGREDTRGSGGQGSGDAAMQPVRKPGMPALAASVLRRLRQPLPGAQPRLRFEM